MPVPNLCLAIKKELVARQKQLEIHNLNNICLEVFKVTGFNKCKTIKQGKGFYTYKKEYNNSRS